MQDRQFSDVSSHGTYGQPPMSHEAYGMHEMGHGLGGSGGVGPGEIFVDPYIGGAAAAGAGAAGIGVARARSTKDIAGGGYAQALNDGASPYPAMAAPSTNGPPPSQPSMPMPIGYGSRGAGSRSPEYELLEAAGMGGMAGGAAGMLARSQSQQQQQQQQQRQYHYQRNQQPQEYGASLGRSPTSGSQYYPPPPPAKGEYYPPPPGNPQGQGQGQQGYGGFVQRSPSQQQQQQPSPRLDQHEEEGDMDDAYGGYEDEGDVDQRQRTTVESHERGAGSLPNPFDAAHSAESAYDDDDEEEEEDRGRRVLKVRFLLCFSFDGKLIFFVG